MSTTRGSQGKFTQGGTFYGFRTTEELLKVVDAWRNAGECYRRGAALLGMPLSTFRDQLKTAAKKGLIASPVLPQPLAPGFTLKEHSVAYDAQGKLRQQWIRTAPEDGEVFTPLPGHVIKGESALVNPEGEIIAKWVKTREGVGAGLVEALEQVFQKYQGAAEGIPLSEDPLYWEDVLTVYPLPDLHFGMYAWGEETGDDYDTDIASKLIDSTVSNLVAQSRPTQKAVILGLGDYFHANDAKPVTPKSGNALDVDGRWARVFSMGAHLAVALVELVAKRHNEVEVVFLKGNHDPDSAMSLTVALSLYYSKTQRIHINTSPGIAWYYRFGKCLLGATHGHSMKPERMAMLLATDRAEDWGQTTYRHFFFGHIHTESAREVGPVRVESFNAPIPRDGWNAAQGYRSGRSMSALTFHKDRGEIGRHRVNLP